MAVKAFKKLPLHVAIIMDGNGRWAKRRFMSRSFGHDAGMKNLIKLAQHAMDIGIPYMTVYALSTENMSRPKEELDNLFDLIRTYFKNEVQKLWKSGVSVKVLGDISVFPEDVQRLLVEGVEGCPNDNNKFTICFALNYGGRAELVRAVNHAVELGNKVNEEVLSSLLYTQGIPDPDLIIRTGGEFRLSNFLTYQSAYSELYFTNVLFPDFNQKHFDKAIKEFGKRNRRFGKV